LLYRAGLRGAVGMALAVGFKGAITRVLSTTVLVVVVLTMLMFGGTTARVLEALQIPMGVEDEGASGDAKRDTVLLGMGRGTNQWLRRRRARVVAVEEDGDHHHGTFIQMKIVGLFRHRCTYRDASWCEQL
jgi:NhaP-type Na+/H+ or K+/H+ antiporter